MNENDPDIQEEKTQSKCYDNPEYKLISSLVDSLVSAKSESRKSSFSKSKTNSGYSIIQCRYIVTLFGFFVYFELDCYRVGTSMSIVRMVNNTAVNIEKHTNTTIDSCPVNNSIIRAVSIQYPEGEFTWSPIIQSYILSAGFLGYVLSQIPAGLLAERYGAQKVLLSGYLISSLAHVLCPFAAWSSSYFLIAMQFLRGIGQGCLPPANSFITAKWFPKQERGFLNSLTIAGYSLGSVLTYTTSGALCSLDLFGGWPLVYFVYGGLGLVFSLCIHLFLYDSPTDHPTISEKELTYILENQECDWSGKQPPTPWRKILTSVPVYVMTYSVFSYFWLLTQQLSEHPIFLGHILHFDIQTNGVLNAAPFGCQILLIFLGGWICKWLNTHGYVGVNKIRKGSTLLYSVGYSVALMGTYFAGCNRAWSNFFTTIAFSFIGICVLGSIIVAFDMSPRYAGSLMAFSNTLGSTATFIFPLIVGAMIDVEESLEQWQKIFLLCIMVVMSSGILFCLFGSAEIQSWNYPSNENKERNHLKDDDVESEIEETILSK